MPPRTPHSPSGNAGASFPARPVSHPGGARSASVSSHDADRHFILYDGLAPEERFVGPRRGGATLFAGDWPHSPEMEERLREEEMASANPLAVAAILLFVSVTAFASGVVAGPAVRQLLAMVP